LKARYLDFFGSGALSVSNNVYISKISTIEKKRNIKKGGKAKKKGGKQKKGGNIGLPAFLGSSGRFCDIGFDITVLPYHAFIVGCPCALSGPAFLGWCIGVGFTTFASARLFGRVEQGAMVVEKRRVDETVQDSD
jgi:hypothetical protein